MRIDRTSVDLSVEVTPFLDVGDLMGGQPTPPWWRPFARRRWFRLLAERIDHERWQHQLFVNRLGAIARSHEAQMEAFHAREGAARRQRTKDS